MTNPVIRWLLTNRFCRSLGLTCLILAPALLSILFNPAATLAQSAVISTVGRQLHRQTFRTSGHSIPNSLNRAQIATEAMLARPVSYFAIRYDEGLIASDVFETLGVTVFVDQNLEGIFEVDDKLEMKAGVSMHASLSNALKDLDATYLIEPEGSILLISIDDEYEPDYMSTVTYDVTSITGSYEQAFRLAGVLQQTISSDSWEQNGGGNATTSVYRNNGRILMTIFQSQHIHVSIRRHFDSIIRLGGGSTVVAIPQRTRNAIPISGSTPSSIVEVPQQQTTSSLRKRRGFARPGSGSTGGMGGGGFEGGVF